MATYATLADLKTAYDSGELSKTDDKLWLDNDSTSVDKDTGEWEPIPGTTYRMPVPTFSMDPRTLLEQALDLLGIPHEHV